MVAPAVDGIDLFKIAGRSISGWIPSFKMGSAAAPVKQPFCSRGIATQAVTCRKVTGKMGIM